MPGRCSCAGSNCSCAVTAGTGVVVQGTGNTGSPYVISVAPRPGAIVVDPSGPLDLSEFGGNAAILITLNGDVTDIALPVDTAVLDLVIAQGGAGDWTVDWPVEVKWPGGAEPILSTAPGSHDWIRLVHAGAVWVGVITGSDLS